MKKSDLYDSLFDNDAFEKLYVDIFKNDNIANTTGVQYSSTAGITKSNSPYSVATSSSTNWSNYLIFDDKTDTKPLTVTGKYPITNLSYISVNRGPITVDLFLNKISINTYMLSKDFFEEAAVIIKSGDLEVFAAKLSDARAQTDNPPGSALEIKKGCVYDPWYRNITSFGPTHYKNLVNNKIETSVSSQGTTQFVYWLFETTIDGTKIKLFIYDHIFTGFFNKKKLTKHFKDIHPYMVYLEDNHNLIVN